VSEETIPQMRERIQELEKQVNGLKGANSELSTTNQTLKAREVFRDQGYDPNQAALFVSQNPEGDVTPESVNEFASKFNLQPLPKEAETPKAESSEEPSTTSVEDTSAASSQAGLAAMSGGGSGPGTGGQQTPGTSFLTREQYNQLAQENPAAARQAVSEGRVQLRRDNPLAVTR
jgi:hypothetical protein